MELRVPGAGHVGYRGGKSGHLFATVKVLAHERFRFVDDDIHLDVPLTLRQALLGGEVSIPTLMGEVQTLMVHAPTQPGATKTLRGRGPPRLGGEGRGNFVLRFLLHLPLELSPRQVQLIEEFDAETAAGRQEAGDQHRKSSAGPYDRKPADPLPRAKAKPRVRRRV